jgi:hypothetical protein
MARWAGPGVKVFREGDGAACREGHRGGGSGRVGVEWYVASGGALQAYRSPRQGLRWGTAELGCYRPASPREWWNAAAGVPAARYLIYMARPERFELPTLRFEA